MSTFLKSSAFVALLGLAGCVVVPTGPAVTVMPGTGKSFDQFRFDDGECRQFAYDQIGGQTAAVAQENSAVSSAIVGAAVGALAGAAIGGNSAGAAVGAGIGLVGGSMAGAGAAQSSAYGAQQRYDVAYQQCMYAKGHRVPVSGRFANSGPGPGPGPRRNYSAPPPPPPNQPPPYY